MRKDNSRNKTLRLTQLALLSAIIIILQFTPLGYLKVGTLSITFFAIPVAIGAVIMGPAEGAILGTIFGATSFLQCFGMDPFGAQLLAINPFYTFLLCFVPRILIGVITGFVYRGLRKVNANNTVSFAVSGLVASLTNTVFFVGLLILLFGNTEIVRQFGDSIIKIFSVIVGFNGIVEAIVSTIVVTSVGLAFKSYMTKGKSK